MLLGPLSAAFGVMANPIPRGCIELPAAYGEHVWGLMKGRPTKYIKRVPKPGGGYRYFYDAGHGGGIDSHEHMVEGAKFAHGEGHFHIVKQDGDKLHVRNTATGEEHTITKQALAQKLAEHHAEGLKAYRDRATKALAEAKANKASPKQIARLEERVKRAGGAKPADPTPKETPKTAPESKPSAEHKPGNQTERAAKLKEAVRTLEAEHYAAKTRQEKERIEAKITPLLREGAALHRSVAEAHEKAAAMHDEKVKRATARDDAAGERAHKNAAALHRAAAKTRRGEAQSGYMLKEYDDKSKAALAASAEADRKPAPRPSTTSSQSKTTKPPTRFDRSYESQQKPSGTAASETSAPKARKEPAAEPRTPRHPTIADERRAHHDDAADEHMKARNQHWNAAEKAKAQGNESAAAAHQAAGDAHHSAVLHHLAARETTRKKEAKEADAQSAKAHSASVSARIIATPKPKPLFES